MAVADVATGKDTTDLDVGNGRTVLNPAELSKAAVLRINRAFMKHMKARRKRLADEKEAAAIRAAEEAALLRGGGGGSSA